MDSGCVLESAAKWADIYLTKGGSMRTKVLGVAMVVMLLCVGVEAQLGNYICVHRTKDIPYGKIGAMYFDSEPLGDTIPEGIAFRWAFAHPWQGPFPWSMDTLVFEPVCNCPLPIKRIRIYRGGENLLLVDRFAPEDSVRWDMEESSDHSMLFADTALVIDHKYTEPEWFSLGLLFWYILPQTLHADSGDSMEVVLSYIPEYHGSSEADSGERHGYRMQPSPRLRNGAAAQPGTYRIVNVSGENVAVVKQQPPASVTRAESGLAAGVYFYRQSDNAVQPHSGKTFIR